MAAAVVSLLRPYVGATILLPFLAAVAVAATYGGLWPGLLATALGVLALDLFFPIPGAHFFSLDALLRKGVSLLTGVLVAALSASMRRARLRAERDAAEHAWLRDLAEQSAMQAQEEAARAEEESVRAEEEAVRAEASASEARQAAERAAVALAALTETEERYRLLAETATDAIVTIDETSTILFVNRAAERIFGHRVAAMQGQSLTMLMPDYLREVHRGGLRRYLDTGERHLDWTLTAIPGLHHDGHEIPLEVSFAEARSGARRWFTGVIRDVTERERAAAALRSSEERYRLAVQATKDVIWDWEPRTGRVTWGGPVNATLGYTAAEVGATTREIYRWWRRRVHPDDRRRIRRAFRTALEAGSRVVGVEYRFRHADGSYATVLDRRLVARDDAGTPQRIVGSLEDITDRRRTERHLQQIERMEAIGRLAGGIAHDLNNMLAAIIGYGRLVLETLPREDTRHDDVQQILQAANKSATLTRQLLTFARRQLVQPRPLDLNGAVRETERLLRSALGAGIELALDLTPASASIHADPSQLEQIILNLSLNARDAMHGDGRLTIATDHVDLDASYAPRHPGTEIAAGRYVRLAVSDTGHGMDAATLARVFEPFFTTKAPGEGTGLGLATVYGAVKQAGGYVWAYSEPGQGAVFKVYFPESMQPAPAAVVEPQPPPAKEAPRGRETILVVEDEPMVRRPLRRALEAYGYRYLEAENGLEALRVLEGMAGAVDLILTDLVMPGMGGRQLADEVAARWPRLPVLFTSGFTSDEVVRRGLVAPGMPFVPKPYPPEQMVRTIREMLDLREATRKARG